MIFQIFGEIFIFSGNFHEISENVRFFQICSGNFRKCQIFQIFQKFPDFSRFFQKISENLRFSKFLRKFHFFRKFPGNFRKFQIFSDFFRIFQKMSDFFKFFQKFSDFFRKFQKFRKSGVSLFCRFFLCQMSLFFSLSKTPSFWNFFLKSDMCSFSSCRFFVAFCRFFFWVKFWVLGVKFWVLDHKFSRIYVCRFLFWCVAFYFGWISVCRFVFASLSLYCRFIFVSHLKFKLYTLNFNRGLKWSTLKWVVRLQITHCRFIVALFSFYTLNLRCEP